MFSMAKANMETVKGKNVLVTGATGGIGSAVVKWLAGSGANVFMTGRDADKLQALADRYAISSNHYRVMDITDETSVKNAIDELLTSAGQLDVLVNAAGIGIIKPMETLTGEEFRRTLDTNLTGSFYLMKAILPSMKLHKKGLIIHIPGVLGKVPMAGAAAYSASKYGLNGMMQSIREELKRTEIRITNLFLGGVDSPFWDTIDLRVQRDKMILAEEAAKAVWFLCQQPASGVVSEMVLQPFNHQAI